MSELVFAVALAFVMVWWSIPRFFRVADARLARLNIATLHHHMPISSEHFVVETPTVDSTRSTLAELASLCDSLARATRGGASPSVAMSNSVERHRLTGAHWSQLLRGEASLEQFSETVSAALQQAHHNHAEDDARCLSLIALAIIDNNLVPSALDHASVVLRESAACRQDMMVAASQARLSARMLTALPFLLSGAAFVISTSFRSSLTSPAVVVCLLLGLALNRVGWRWISRHISAALSEQPSLGESLADHLCVSLRAGLTISQACERWNNTCRVGTQVARSLQNGDSLGTSLKPLAESADESARGLADVVLQAEHDGLPVLSTVNRLSTETRLQRRRSVDTRIRQLPTRLSVPLVICVLPSFLFLSVAPLVLSSLSTLTISLPPATS
jgi:tight adherence protein B